MMRCIHFDNGMATELAAVPDLLPAQGFVWVSCTRSELEAQTAQFQASLQALAGTPLVDLHVSDLLNAQLPSHYDFTSDYDVMVFRRLAGRPDGAVATPPAGMPAPPAKKGGVPALRHIDTSPVACVVFDRLLLSVHPEDMSVRDAYCTRLLQAPNAGARPDPRNAARMPASPADLMLRLVSLMVDGFLDLRRVLSQQLDHWQAELINPRTRFTNWQALLEARQSLHRLEEICDDQRSAVMGWIESLKSWPSPDNQVAQRERELLEVRSRDVLEHIERVLHHVRRLEQTSETAIQIHFSVQGSRGNDIMRTFTVLTAIFLPLNLITGFFGMNFEFMPLIHRKEAFWWVVGLMSAIAIGTSFFFWRKRYLSRTVR
jgi:magnesium transporter